MPQEGTGTDVSEVRSQMDAVQSDTSERMSEMQDEYLGYTEEDEIEVMPEQANYRVMISDYGCVENDDLYTE